MTCCSSATDWPTVPPGVEYIIVRPGGDGIGPPMPFRTRVPGFFKGSTVSLAATTGTMASRQRRVYRSRRQFTATQLAHLNAVAMPRLDSAPASRRQHGGCRLPGYRQAARSGLLVYCRPCAAPSPPCQPWHHAFEHSSWQPTSFARQPVATWDHDMTVVVPCCDLSPPRVSTGGSSPLCCITMSLWHKAVGCSWTGPA